MKPTNVDQYVAGLPADHAAIVTELRGIVKKAAPKATETFKWAQPVYEANGPMIWIKAFTNYVNIGFWRGTEMQDKNGLLEGDGERMRHVKLHSCERYQKGRADRLRQASGQT